MKHACYGIDDTETILQDVIPYSRASNTLSEEFVHAAQKNVFGNLFPSEEKQFRRDDEKLWNLSVEAQAKLVAAVIMVEQSINGRPELMGAYVSAHDGINVEMVKATMNLYLQHGQDRIRQQPELLAPVYFSFFQDADAMEGYHDQALEYINEIDPQNTEPILMADYIKAFGALPGFEGNMLSGALSDKYLMDVAAFIPRETELGQWFDVALQAGVDGEPIPDLQPIGYDDEIMSYCVEPDNEHDSLEMFKGQKGMTP